MKIHTPSSLRTASVDELDEIMERTEYAAEGVAAGAAAAQDQDLRRMVERELGRRWFGNLA